MVHSNQAPQIQSYEGLRSALVGAAESYLEMRKNESLWSRLIHFGSEQWLSFSGERGKIRAENLIQLVKFLPLETDAAKNKLLAVAYAMSTTSSNILLYQITRRLYDLNQASNDAPETSQFAFRAQDWKKQEREMTYIGEETYRIPSSREVFSSLITEVIGALPQSAQIMGNAVQYKQFLDSGSRTQAMQVMTSVLPRNFFFASRGETRVNDNEDYESANESESEVESSSDGPNLN